MPKMATKSELNRNNVDGLIYNIYRATDFCLRKGVMKWVKKMQ